VYGDDRGGADWEERDDDGQDGHHNEKAAERETDTPAGDLHLRHVLMETLQEDLLQAPGGRHNTTMVLSMCIVFFINEQMGLPKYEKQKTTNFKRAKALWEIWLKVDQYGPLAYHGSEIINIIMTYFLENGNFKKCVFSPRQNRQSLHFCLKNIKALVNLGHPRIRFKI